MKTILLLIFTLSIFFSNAENKKAMALYQKAMSEKGLMHIDESLVLFKEAIAEDPSNITFYFQRSLILKDIKKDYSAAMFDLQKVWALDKEFSLFTLRYMGDCLFYNWKITEAKEKYLAYIMQPTIEISKNKYVEVQIANCNFIEQNIDIDHKSKIVNLGPSINTSGMEYYPSMSADDEYLVFSRRKDHSEASDENIFYSIKIDTSWSIAEPLQGDVNTSGDEGAHCISPSGKYLLFTGCNRPGQFIDTKSCDIYIAKKSGNKWTNPNFMGSKINTSAWESQPSISADGKTLFFSSTRPGGMGGSDIWYSVMDDKGQFGEPINPGNSINTSMNEEKPFLHPDGETIYFVSNGHPGYGGTDIYKTKKIGAYWLTPTNLGSPINSMNDEKGIFVNANGDQGYIESNRPGGYGDLDIYSVEMYHHNKPTQISVVKGKVMDINGKYLKSTGQIIELETNTVKTTFSSDSLTGEFVAMLPVGKNYMFNVSKSGYLFYSDHYEIQNEIGKQYRHDIVLKQISKGEKITLKNVFFNINQFVLKPESGNEINKLIELLRFNPTIKLEIAGHTDNIGTEVSNILLSENRAKAVYQYLISKNVPATKLSYKGYGSSKPKVSNDNPEGRAQNRRTEVEIK
jgi:outer membrane protein OmpA-like peptidoglycan-associated protein/Tol biopolymer transport system component